MKRKIYKIEQVTYIMSIVSGIILLLIAFLPWVNYTMVGLSVGGNTISTPDKCSYNLFQYGIDGRMILVVAATLALVAGVVLLSFGLFSILERRLGNLSYIIIIASVIGMVGMIIALTNADIRDEYKAAEIAKDFIKLGVPWGRILSIVDIVAIFITNVFCIMGLANKSIRR